MQHDAVLEDVGLKKTSEAQLDQDSNLVTVALDKDFCDELGKYIANALSQNEKTILFLPTKRAAAYIEKALDSHPNRHIVQYFCLGDIHLDWLQKLNVPKNLWPTEKCLSSDKRQFLLTQLIENYPCQWIKGETQTPSFATAYQLAEELSYLLDQFYREQIYPVKFQELIPISFAQHWQHHLGFLQLINEYWPEILREQHMIDRIPYEQKILQAIQVAWQQNQPDARVILAGSSLSQPMIQNFAEVISSLERGQIFFCGGVTAKEDGLEAYHPFANIQKFSRTKQLIGDNSSSVKGQWLQGFIDKKTPITPPDDLDLTILESTDIFQEAQQIVQLIEGWQTQNHTVNIVTNNSVLVSYILQLAEEKKVNIENLTGVSLAKQDLFQYMQLLLEVVHDEFSPVAFLAFLKHPLTAFDEDNAQELIEHLEKKYLRGPKIKSGLEALTELVRQDAELLQLIASLKAKFQPFVHLTERKKPASEEWIQAHFLLAELLIDGNIDLPQEDLLEAFGEQHFTFAEYRFLFDVFGQKNQIKSEHDMTAPIQILSPMNARLKHADKIIMADLNEGSWPQIRSFDPWLNQFMAQKIGLLSLEKSLGLSLLDFTYLLGANQVYLTRAKKDLEGATTHMSRWLKRLEWYCEVTGFELKKQAVIAQQTEVSFQPIKPPNPTPIISARPTKYSVTKIEKLMRDPYAFYAEKILELRPLAELEEDPGLANYGQMVHAVLEKFFAKYPSDLPDDAEAQLFTMAEKMFVRFKAWPQLWAFWWPRLKQTLHWVLQQEIPLHDRKRYVEIEGVLSFEIEDQDYRLYAKADRIDLIGTGGAQIIDYKTGSLPSKKEMDAGFSPQLPLEAALYFHKAFDLEESDSSDVITLSFYRLRGDHIAGEIKDYIVTREVCEKALQGCKNLIAHFTQQENGYPCQPTPELAPTYSDYDHLARIEEWNKK